MAKKPKDIECEEGSIKCGLPACKRCSRFISKNSAKQYRPEYMGYEPVGREWGAFGEYDPYSLTNTREVPAGEYDTYGGVSKMYVKGKEIVNKIPRIPNKLNPKDSKKGKPDLASVALHPDFDELLAQVAEVSVEKGYEPLNWLEPNNEVTVTKLISAARRHENMFRSGHDYNQETKLGGERCSITAQHLAHAAYSLLMAAVIIKKGITELDDRKTKKVDK